MGRRTNDDDETTRSLKVPVLPPEPAPTPNERAPASSPAPSPSRESLAPVVSVSPLPPVDPVKVETREVLTQLLATIPADLSTVMPSSASYQLYLALRRRAESLLAYY